MPFTQAARHEGKYVLIRHEGRLTIQEYEESTVITRRLLDEHRWNRLLIDLRDVTNRVSITDVYYIIAFDQKVFPLVQIAVIFPPEHEEDGRFADNVAANRGVNLRSFVDCEQAVAWLTAEKA